MRFLVDECTGPRIAEWLRSEEHDVFSVYEQARGISDELVLQKAVDENRILITNDKDFGEKIFREHKPHCGVVLLRLSDERFPSKRDVLGKLLENHVNQLPNHFTVVSEDQIRFARR